MADPEITKEISIGSRPQMWGLGMQTPVADDALKMKFYSIT